MAGMDNSLKEIDDAGYTILEDAIELDLIDALKDELLRLEDHLGIVPATNAFEGTKTVRIYNLLAFGPDFSRIPLHPEVLPLVESVLDPGLLVSSLSSIAIDPGETAQPIHADDQIIPLPKPHPATVCNTMWALTDFTEANGATRVIPGSHKADRSPDFGTHYDSVPAEMAKGSVLVWHGSLWHGGGSNDTSERRMGIAMNYCAGYIRQQENQQLGLPLGKVRTFPARLQELCGFGLYHGIIGHIDKQVPNRLLLDADTDPRLLWDLS